MKEVTENGVTFNQSEPNECVLVHIGTKIVYHGIPEGKVETQQTMFTGTEAECDAYILANDLIEI